jgi:hypothetical protein
MTLVPADRRALRRILLLLLVLSTQVGCGPARSDIATTPAPAPAVESTDPALAFQALEARLLRGEADRASFRITASGALTGALDGVLVVSGEAGLSLDAVGTFGGQEVALHLRVADGEMTGGNGSEAFREPAPARVLEAVIIGLTRMGLMHNLARLVAGRPPDHAAGGVADWVQVEDVAWIPVAEDSPGPGIGFGIVVAGQRAADAELYLDASALPLRRLQTVRFPGGEMRVLEEYIWP